MNELCNHGIPWHAKFVRLVFKNLIINKYNRKYALIVIKKKAKYILYKACVYIYIYVYTNIFFFNFSSWKYFPRLYIIYCL